MTTQQRGQSFGASPNDFDNDFNTFDFDPFNSSSGTTTTAASTKISGSVETVEYSMASSDKKKKKKKDKDKEKKSSSSSRRNSSTKSRRKSFTDDSVPSADASKKLFAKMINDAYGDDFGNSDEEDPFDEVCFDDDGWAASTLASKSGRSSNGETHSSSSATPRTGMHTYSTGDHVVESSADSAGARTPESKAKVILDMNIEDMFSQQPSHQEPLDGFDDNTVVSDLTGFTGILQGLSEYDSDEENEEDEEDPDLPSIMKKLLQEHPTTEGASSRRITNSYPESYSRPLATSSQSPKVSKSEANRTIGFSTVTIRFYERILTENPSTIQGPSIGIGWTFEEKPSMDLNTYESERGEPLPSWRLVLNREERETLLSELGVSSSEIAAGVRRNNKARQQRRQTVQNLKAIKIEEALEGVKKKIWRPFGGKFTK